MLRALEQSGLDQYPLPDQLLGLFQRMQDFQLRCAADPALAGYRRKAYTPAAVRVPTIGPASRRRRYVPLAPPRTDTSS
jgi:hypothetical protein